MIREFRRDGKSSATDGHRFSQIFCLCFIGVYLRLKKPAYLAGPVYEANGLSLAVGQILVILNEFLKGRPAAKPSNHQTQHNAQRHKDQYP